MRPAAPAASAGYGRSGLVGAAARAIGLGLAGAALAPSATLARLRGWLDLLARGARDAPALSLIHI